MCTSRRVSGQVYTCETLTATYAVNVLLASESFLLPSLIIGYFYDDDEKNT